MPDLNYRNPVYGHYMADPFVLKVGRDYYAYGTGGHVNNGRQADGRFYPVLHSTDLVHWTPRGGALTPIDDSAHYWAPEVAHHGGTFYMYYSLGQETGWGHQIRVATSATPTGPFKDAGVVLLPQEPFNIDPHPFRDPRDGRWYLYFAKDYLSEPVGTGAAVVPLHHSMLKTDGPITDVIRAQGDWQIFERDRLWYGRTWPKWHTVEGPFVIARGGKYYCFYSGGCWHKPNYGVGVGVADNPLGSFVDDADRDGPAVLSGIEGAVRGPGHASFVLGPDDATWFIVYHAWDAEWTTRRMCIDPITWDGPTPRCDGPSHTARRVPLRGV